MVESLTIMVVGIFIWFEIKDIKTELRYRNTLLKEQNEILKRDKK